MHNDITQILREFTHSGYTVKIVEREMDTKFLYFYVMDDKGRDEGGMHYYGYSDVTKDDLADLEVGVLKIKRCIDKRIVENLEWEKQKIEKKKAINWTGRTFNRGDYVNFKGNEKYRAFEGTYVWTWFGHECSDYYLIEHPDGHDRKRWLTSRGFPDGFESVHSSQLREGLKYIEVHCHPEFMGETDELILIKPAEKQI